MVEITSLTSDGYIEVLALAGFHESDANVGPDCIYLTAVGETEGAWFRLVDRRPAHA